MGPLYFQSNSAMYVGIVAAAYGFGVLLICLNELRLGFSTFFFAKPIEKGQQKTP